MLKGTISFAVVLVLCAGLYAQDHPEISVWQRLVIRCG